jgi:predicted nicotinamide N-methyase
LSKLELKNETITMNQVDYRIQSLKNNQQYIEGDTQAESLGISSATWPLFGVIWPSSIILASTVATMKLNTLRVLEIGCGIAFSSIVLHSKGVDVTASDYHPLTRQFLDTNIRNNSLPPIQYQTGNWETANHLLGKFDLIIGSDILYEPAHARNVSEFISNHSLPGVQVIIVDPNRSNRSHFTKRMIALGFSYHSERFSMMDLERKHCKGHILYYQRQT